VEYREKGIQLRDVGTSAFDGLTVPQYLTGLYANTARAGRPLADNARRLDLPADGMTVNIARVTTGVTAAIQATQNATVSETDIDDTNLVIDVRTIAGSQDVALQAIQRSTGAEAVILEDLIMAYHTELDNQIINGSGASGQHRGIRNVSGISAVTYTDSTPTGIEAYGPLWNIQSVIEAAVFRRATHFVMHPRRFNFFASTVSTRRWLVLTARRRCSSAQPTTSRTARVCVVSSLAFRSSLTPTSPPTFRPTKTPSWP
jgi:HK97 family phage major capsid protein